MKRMLVMVLMAMAVAGTAQAAKPATVGVNAGLTVPIGNLGDAAGAGFHLGGEYCYHVSDMLGLGGDLVYHKLGSKDVTVGASSAKSKFSVIEYGVHAKYMMPSSSDVHPFLKFGLGLYTGKVSSESNIGGANYNFDSSSTDVGFNLGGGADWKMNDKMGWGVNGAFHYISSEGDASTMISLGAGLKWGIGS